ncbi:hypothetical protein TI39_contig623g00014 [Zymoseptoria brevis]|uniref:Uncharacterized protein n=1 Tax=Zymoseptoria brevis TaxID=1047168 RepID=A0A0F4GHI5_9PEZI|nr:hypothetical protein TI39_contig623g00014 [Zymoseptoria brevis]
MAPFVPKMTKLEDMERRVELCTSQVHVVFKRYIVLHVAPNRGVVTTRILEKMEALREEINGMRRLQAVLGNNGQCKQ